ncbi:uncharacterized protein TRAVEDRAFT_23290 [Trametes versicolor FP-101664 SS1]|uniref:uncharacterized protein n=1 Tax=Trametes versicolor (strain FP-101664) TaxID=717944 RepID=UPI0004623426|nr:uncharacterized protein TRAVEDRAFT_23290 [Trametes versicolor FP-101664 SS1]EIW54069.1 hypothetical protein TRAVEDRAFT_23290 [Trametes versicolor FP-101664 SS1]
MSTISALAQRSASSPQTNNPDPSSSTSSASLIRTHGIHVVIPQTQSTARVATPTTTPIHGNPLSSAASSPGGFFSILETPTHGHGDFVVPSSSSYRRDSPTTPTQPRMSARTRRRSSLFSASSMNDEDADASASATGPGAGGLTMSPMDEEGEEHEHNGLHGDEDGLEDQHEDERAVGAEGSSEGSLVDEAHTNAPLLGAA